MDNSAVEPQDGHGLDGYAFDLTATWSLSRRPCWPSQPVSPGWRERCGGGCASIRLHRPGENLHPPACTLRTDISLPAAGYGTINQGLIAPRALPAENDPGTPAGRHTRRAERLLRMLLRTLAVLAGALVLASLAIGAHAGVVPVAFYADESLTIVSRDVPASGTAAEAAAQALVDGPTEEESAAGLYSALPPGTSAVKIATLESSITVDSPRTCWPGWTRPACCASSSSSAPLSRNTPKAHPSFSPARASLSPVTWSPRPSSDRRPRPSFTKWGSPAGGPQGHHRAVHGLVSHVLVRYQRPQTCALATISVRT